MKITSESVKNIIERLDRVHKNVIRDNERIYTLEQALNKIKQLEALEAYVDYILEALGDLD